MEKTKKCPNCLKTHDIKATKCEECGFEFHVVEVEDEIAATNTHTVDDRTSPFLWKVIAFFLPFIGFILAIVWHKKWPERSQVMRTMAFVMAIVWFFVGIIMLYIMCGIKSGDILVD